MRQIRPMLAHERAENPDLSDDWLLEVKHDGFRCILRTDLDDEVRLFTRRGKENSASFPEITSLSLERGLILDGELIAYSEVNGDSKLSYMQSRNNVVNKQKLGVLTKRFPVSFVAFDILKLEDTEVMHQDLSLRKEYLKEVGNRNTELLVIDSYATSDYELIWRFVKANRLEGLVAKRKDGLYVEGTRSYGWRKMKW